MPPAARLTDMHACPMFTGTVPHLTGAIVGPGIATVLIENKPAAVMGDSVACSGPPATIVKGSATVMIGGKPAARVGDSTNHGGSILPPGCLTVIIGG
ncbi:MAG: PAAR domain-containing protein [Bacteroidota bacterium]